jgi:hypothetical protein
VVVTGYKWISDSYSVQLPQYAALLVLHDPPGGLIDPVALLYHPFFVSEVKHLAIPWILRIQLFLSFIFMIFCIV